MEHRPNMYRIRRDLLIQSMSDNEISIAAALEYKLTDLFDLEDRVAWQRGTLASSA